MGGEASVVSIGHLRRAALQLQSLPLLPFERPMATRPSALTLVSNGYVRKPPPRRRTVHAHQVRQQIYIPPAGMIARSLLGTVIGRV